MEFIRAAAQDLEELLSLYRLTAEKMEEGGIRHWHWGRWPNEEIIRRDAEEGSLYCLRTGGGIMAAVSVTAGQEEAYESLSWTCGVKPGSFRRLAVHPSAQGKGLGGTLLEEAERLLRAAGCDCVRCDTSENNLPALRFYEKHGYRRCGRLRWEDAPGDNIAFDRALVPDAPLLPVRMEPVFRSGAQTPWGGERLRTRFGKRIPDSTAGESLEASCIPGKESTDPLGRKLPDLIREFGEKLVGKYAEQPFPLLLKLIDARDRLSVQVHPDDEYAAAHEHGKFGKSEAWLILDAAEGSELVYGLKPGTTLEELRKACENGKDVEPLLRRVPVSRGDVCYIPAGCIHSIGAGILLYEIQESSDLTYRFYDWDRKDAQGRGRELHISQALAVVNPACAPQPVRVPKESGISRPVDEESFTLDVIRCGGTGSREESLPRGGDFGFLTALEGQPVLRWDGGEMVLREGETCLLPGSAPELRLCGAGCAALAMPKG